MSLPSYLRLALATLLLCTLPILPASAQETLRILTWPGYADADLVRDFAARNDVKVEVSYVSTDDELREKLSTNRGANYDLITANTAEIQHYVSEQLLLPLQLDSIPNTKRQLWRFRNLQSIPGISHDGKVFAIPYTYSEMGLIYDRQQFPVPPTSLASLWDPHYQGKVLAYDGSSHNFSITSLLLGGNPFQISEQAFAPVTQKLVALRRNVLTFYTLPEESVRLFRQHQVALLYANYGRQQLKQLQDAGADVGYVIPKEGALAWLDCWAISRGAKNPALAASWINFTLEPRVSKELTLRQGLSNTIETASENGNMDKIIWLEPVEDAPRRAALWSRISSGDSPQALERP